MGQYYKVVNIDKKQFLHPHKFDDGLKLCEFGASGGGTMFGLAALLANGNGQGGGDIRSASPVIGSWAGDRIVIAGDYGEPGRFLADGEADAVDSEDEAPNLYTVASQTYEDISEAVLRAIANDKD